MKLGAFNPLFGNLELSDMLDKFAALGLEAVEIATGGFVGDNHCDPAKLTEALLFEPTVKPWWADSRMCRGHCVRADLLDFGVVGVAHSSIERGACD